MRTRNVVAATVTALLSACASTQTSCPLNNEYGYCASIQQVHAAAVSGGGNAENVMAGVGAADGNAALRTASGHRLFDPGAGAGLAGPIYHPAKPRRLWAAPWTDANGTLHSGEYLYFLSPGHWNYGPLRAPGAAAGLMGPVSPGDLGFVPGTQPDSTGNIQRPATTLMSGQQFGNEDE